MVSKVLAGLMFYRIDIFSLGVHYYVFTACPFSDKKVDNETSFDPTVIQKQNKERKTRDRALVLYGLHILTCKEIKPRVLQGVWNAMEHTEYGESSEVMSRLQTAVITSKMKTKEKKIQIQDPIMLFTRHLIFRYLLPFLASVLILKLRFENWNWNLEWAFDACQDVGSLTRKCLECMFLDQ